MNKRILTTLELIGGLVIILVLAVDVLSTSTMVCKGSFDQSKNGYTLNTKYVIKARGKIVKKIKITETIQSNDKKLLNDFKEQFEREYSYNKKNYGGYDYQIINKNDKVVANLRINYRHFDMKKFVKNNGAMKDFTVKNKLTLSGAKKLYESTGAICK